MDRKKNQYGADIIAVLLQKIAVNCGQDLPPLHLTETGDPGQHEWLLRRKAFLDRRRNCTWHDESGGENVKPCAYGFPLLY